MGANEGPFIHQCLEESPDSPEGSASAERKGLLDVTFSANGRLGYLPQELRDAKQWCIAGPDKAPYVVSPQGVFHASVHKSDQWKTFVDAERDMHATEAPGVGLVLTFQDPWTCIDIDVCNAETQRLKGQPIDPAKWSTAEEIDRYQSIVTTLDSYTEVSALGYGLHIWVKGRIGLGVKRDGIEIYSQERFLICTGNVYVDKPIEDRQDILDNMVTQMRGPGFTGPTPLLELEPEESDMTVFERASTAANSEKFNALCNGNWRGEYPSQSEADLALLSMICFYSRSNEQCRRLFRCTSLGQREKAVKNDRYLNYTLELIRTRQAQQDLISRADEENARAYIAQIQGTNYGDVVAARIATETTPVPKPEVNSSISWPPGLCGALAGFIYNSAPRPVKEVAIVAALGFLAGVCGKAFNISQTGLNLYIILIARSGIGKEAMLSGTNLIIKNLQQELPVVSKFVVRTQFASGPALTKAVAENPSFVHVAGEWGRRLMRMAEDRDMSGPMTTLRTEMTDMYQKSGEDDAIGGITYSNKEQNITSIQSAAYSMIGETTPGTFYRSLTHSMMEDGFMSRFLIIEYNGDRPALNQERVTKMHPALSQALVGLCKQALTLISRFNTETIVWSTEAKAELDSFDRECDININKSVDEGYRQMWNRAHLKVIRIAGILAAADNCLQPFINLEHAQWAIEVVRRDIRIMSSKFDSGDVGTDDVARERKMLMVLKDYLKYGPRSEAYGVHPQFAKERIVPYRFLYNRLSGTPQYKLSPGGANKAVNSTILNLIDAGYMVEIAKAELIKTYEGVSRGGRAFRVIVLPEYING